MSMSLYDKFFPPRIITLDNGKRIEEKRSRAPLVIFILLALSAISVKVTGFRLSTIITRGNQFWVILGRMFPPDTAYIGEIWDPLFDTIKMSIIGSLIGALIAVPMAMIASSNIIKSRMVILISRLALSIARTLPTLVTALIATFIWGLGTTAGTVAISIFTFSYVGKLLYEQIETVGMGSFEAMEAIGCSRIRAFWCAIIPQVLPGYLSNSLYCFEGNVRYAAVLGYVGAGGIGIIINTNLGWRDYSRVGMILLVLFITVVVIEYLSFWLRSKLT